MKLLSARTTSDHPLRSAIKQVDHAALDWAANTNHGALQPVLSVAARAADLLLPWVAVSLRMLTGRTGHARGTVVRAWAGMGLAAFIENGVLKPTIDRGRPDPDHLPPKERRASRPSTSSFPSGHIGAATAFAVVAGHEVPRLRVPLVTIALTVAYTHFYSGRHYVSDAVVGAAVGAAAGGLVNRLTTGGGTG